MTVVQRAKSFEHTWDHPEGAASAVLGGYRLLTELAVGELCSVSLARSLQSSRGAGVVAVKRLRTPHQNSAGRSRLLREARVLLSLRAPNLVRVLEIHTQPELFVVMEHVPGASLRSLLARAREVDALRYIVPIFVDALRGLSVLHNWKDEEGAPGFLVHQAPTARHMLVGMDGVARLIDLSHVHGRQLGTGEGVFRGERTAAAPEQLEGRAALDPRCDIFIVGTALLEALACARDARAAMLSESHVRARLGSLLAIGQRARSSDRSARFWSADEMAYALQKAADEADLYADRAAVGAYVRRVLALEAPPDAARVSRPPLVARTSEGSRATTPPPLPSFIAAPVPRPCVPPPAPTAASHTPSRRPPSAPTAVFTSTHEQRGPQAPQPLPLARALTYEPYVTPPRSSARAVASSPNHEQGFPSRPSSAQPAAPAPSYEQRVAPRPSSAQPLAPAPSYEPPIRPRRWGVKTVMFESGSVDVAQPPSSAVPRASWLSAHPTPTGLRGSAHDATALRLPTTTRRHFGLVLGSGAVIVVLLVAALRSPQPAHTPALPSVPPPAASEVVAPSNDARLPQAEPPLHPVVTSIVAAPAASSPLARVVISVPQPRPAPAGVRPTPRAVPPAPSRAQVQTRDEEARELPVLDLYEDGLRSLSPRLPSNPYE